MKNLVDCPKRSVSPTCGKTGREWAIGKLNLVAKPMHCEIEESKKYEITGQAKIPNFQGAQKEMVRREDNLHGKEGTF